MSDSDDDAAFASADEGEINEPSAGGAMATQKIKEKKQNVEETTKQEPQKQASGRNEGKGKNKKKKRGKNGGKETGKTSTDEKLSAKKLTEEKVVQSEERKTVKPDEIQSETDAQKTQAITKTSTLVDDKKSQDSSDKQSQDSSDKQSDINLNKQSKISLVKQPQDSSDKQSQINSDKQSISQDKHKTVVSEENSSKTDQKDSVTKTPVKTDNVSNNNIVTESPQSVTIPRERDHTPEQEEVLENLTTAAEEQSSGAWGWGWGSSLLKTATSSVSTFTHQVGDGFTTLMDTVETSLGAPPPEEMAKDKTISDTEKDEIKEKRETDKPESQPKTDAQTKTLDEKTNPPTAEGADGGGWFSNISSLVQNTVSESIGVLETIGTGSLDVMEKIGKKTYSVITDHDPGFRKARQFLGNKGDKQNLSSLLRDAKDETDQKIEMEKESEEARKCHFGCLFDDYQGLAHLEALEILSNQSEKRVQTLLHAMSEETIAEIKPELLQIKDIFEIDENDDEETEHDFVKLVTDQLTELHLGTTPDKLNKVQEKTRKWLVDFHSESGDDKTTTISRDPKEIHRLAIQSLAELTSKSVEQFHKAGELILLQKDGEKSYLDRSKALAGLTQVLCTEVGILSTKFSHCLNTVGESEEASEVVNPLVTNIYLEATNSSTYIQDAFELLLPVLQNAVIQNSDVLQ
ncbi:protein FAM114A2 [Patella vulgata]|uniref:protein FAM114A2 n=1 Tax=Patella vulgata TaxID=6465 RepID=UPI0024A83D02|nr:protein FAM114A2 [Patella vulgata]